MKEIILKTGDICLVSNEDFDYLNQWNWNTDGREVFSTNYIKMHHIIAKRMEIINFEEIDHKDRNYLNNQRDNLRAATRSQNVANTMRQRYGTSDYRGVSYMSLRKKWRARIANKTIGYFDSEIEAAKAYNRLAKNKYGEFAILNKLN